jgi:hypothetical protein
MSAVIYELAQLARLSSTPTLHRAVGRGMDLTPAEAYVASLIGMKTDVATILAVSALGEEDTLRALAQLITLGLVGMRPAAAG